MKSPRKPLKSSIAQKPSPREKAPAKPIVKDLVWVDASKRRRKELKKYLQQTKEFSRLTQILKKHEDEDAEAFRRWVSGIFLTRIDEMEVLSGEIHRLDELLKTLRRYQSATGQSRYQSYLKVSEAQADGTLEELLAVHCREKDPFCEDPFRQDGPQDFEDLFGFFDGTKSDDFCHQDHNQEFWQGNSSAPSASSQRGSTEGNSLLKDLYRKLVRALHPDLGHETNDEQSRRWSAVQAAYRDQDVAKMRELYDQILCDPKDRSQDGPLLEALSLGELITLSRKIQQQLRVIRLKLVLARDEPHWNFQKFQETASEKIVELRRRLDTELRIDRAHKQDVLRALKQKLKRWSSPNKGHAKASLTASIE
jgi:hypothetical protein